MWETCHGIMTALPVIHSLSDKSKALTLSREPLTAGLSLCAVAGAIFISAHLLLGRLCATPPTQRVSRQRRAKCHPFPATNTPLPLDSLGSFLHTPEQPTPRKGLA